MKIKCVSITKCLEQRLAQVPTKYTNYYLKDMDWLRRVYSERNITWLKESQHLLKSNVILFNSLFLRRLTHVTFRTGGDTDAEDLGNPEITEKIGRT